VSPHTAFAVSVDGRHIVTSGHHQDASAPGLFVYDAGPGDFVDYIQPLGGGGFSRPVRFRNVTTCSKGRIYAVDMNNGVVHVLSPQFDVVALVGESGGLSPISECIVNDSHVVCSHSLLSCSAGDTSDAFVVYELLAEPAGIKTATLSRFRALHDRSF
jgi:hypothetical protein